MAREGFVLYHEMLEWLEPYGDAECGRLLKAMLSYSITGEAPGLSGNERFLWPAIKAKIDQDKKAYEATCERNRKNVTRRYDRIPDDATVDDGVRPYTTVDDRIPNLPTETETKTETKTKQKLNTREIAHARGEYGWVKLTDSQYEKLLKDLGQEELDRCIRYVDESAQNTHNRNGWTDWNLTVRKCSRDGWGLKQQTSTAKPKQYTTAAEYKPPKPISSLDEMWKLVDQI